MPDVPGIPVKAGPSVPTVTVADVPADLQDTVLVDVREDDEWQTGHAAGALHLRLGELIERLSEIPDDAQIVVTCRGGGRSSRAVTWLNANGFDAVNLEGGMRAWQESGRELVSGNGGAGHVH